MFILNKLKEAHQLLIVEIGMDRFGEIAETCQTIQPDVSVLTSISETHLEKLGSLERIKETKAGILEALPSDGLAVLNGNDKHVVDISDRAPGNVVWFGEERKKLQPFYSAKNVQISVEGTSYTLSLNNKALGEVQMQIFGKAAVYAGTAAAAVGDQLGLFFEQIEKGLSKLQPAPHRLNLLKTSAGFRVLDDSYNASDVSTIAALDVLSAFGGKRKMAVLGDMLELGDYEKDAHEKVGRRAAEVLDILVAVGVLGKIIGETAKINGLENVFFADDAKSALNVMKEEIKLMESDLILVKASRGMHLEDVVEGLR